MARWNVEERERYARFHAAQIDNWDVDPVYPILTYLGDGLGPEGATRLALLYVAYYDMGSALLALALGAPTSQDELSSRFPCGQERRNHRMPERLVDHYRSLTEHADGHGGWYPWMSAVAGCPEPAYDPLYAALTTVRGNGRWAAYKTAELLSHVLLDHSIECDWSRVEPDNMAYAHSTGPRHGLDLLLADGAPVGNGPPAANRGEQLGELLTQWLLEQGIDASIATVETTLCDYHAMTVGRYYPGHDIDKMQDQLTRAEAWLKRLQQTAPHTQGLDTADTLFRWAWQGRAFRLPEHYLGELNGWTGVDLPRKKIYRATGELVLR